MSSNDYTQVRGYINSRMPQVDSDFKEWTGSLADIGNIPRTLLDTVYHIELGEVSVSPNNDAAIQDSVPVIITIFKQGFNSATLARDQLLQKANCVRLDVINPKNVEVYKSANDGNIEDVQSVSFTPSEIDISNDNTLKVTIGLNVRLFFGIT